MVKESQDRLSLLRSILRTLGLSTEAIDDIIERILDFLSEKDAKNSTQVEFPYSVKDDFLSAAEQSFYLVLKTAVEDWALICPKVALGDLFAAKSTDPSKYRTYINKIDRKHVDFLLCDPKTVRPLVGIELDDKSHQRADRQARDEFVEHVFAAAKLPLVRIPVRQAYSVSELKVLLNRPVDAFCLKTSSPQVSTETQNSSPCCPQCGSEMVLRTAKSGTNQGGQFWGCSNFPRCRGILKYSALL
jgi:hypothetical protein